jgi:RimJ/RimL family protein N-acetyltransferase
LASVRLVARFTEQSFSSPETETSPLQGAAREEKAMMFARTTRLLLRPGWAEDAPALAAAIADETIVRNLAKVPWPYGLADALSSIDAAPDPGLPRFLMFERTAGAPRLVGSCSLHPNPSGAIVMGYWVARGDWNRGFATEAGAALVEIAAALRLPRIEGAHFVDNPASGRVLEKLGFADTGITATRYSCGRGGEAVVRLMTLRLGADQEALAA